MSELDVAKTRIAYYQVWLGILLVTDLSVAGWFVSNLDEADAKLLAGAVLTMAVLTIGIIALHRQILRHIAALRELK